jgi:hypothetical protein
VSKHAKIIVAALLIFGALPLGAAIVIQQLGGRTDIEARYRVSGVTLQLVDGERQDWHTEGWDRFIELVPVEYRTIISHYEALIGFNDGEVRPNDDSLVSWTLSLADNPDPGVRDATIIHELGHLITLKPGQLTAAVTAEAERNCTTYFTGEGCAVSGSVFDVFVREFWGELSTYDIHPEQAQDRYSADSSAFVTGYAATNPGEDIAETFVFFVYQPEPVGDTIAEDKIRLLWEFPELVQLRGLIRARL